MGKKITLKYSVLQDATDEKERKENKRKQNCKKALDVGLEPTASRLEVLRATLI